MKRIYYLAIAAAILTAIVIFSMLNYTALHILYLEHSNSHNINDINVFFITRHGKLIQNVSVSLFAFYPTSNGTVIKQIYQGFNLTYLSIPVSNLTWHAKYWLGTYNYTILIPNGTSIIKKHILYNASLIIPSLIGLASYYVVNQTNGTMTIYTQAFSVRVSPYNITHGIGKTVIRAFVNPIVQIVKLNKSSSPSSSYAVNPQQTTITTTTTTIPQVVSYAGISFVLTKYWVYPSNSSTLGPIPLALAYVTDYIASDYGGVLTFYESATSTSATAIGFGVTIAKGTIQYGVGGYSITLSSGSYSNSTNAYLGNAIYSYTCCPYPPYEYPYIAEVYAEGQIAYTEYTSALGMKLYMFFVTALMAIGENGAYVPFLFVSNELPPNGSLSFFQGQKLKPFFKVYPDTPNSGSTGSISVSTSQGALSGSIPIEAILQYTTDIPDWLYDIVTPAAAIATFYESGASYVVTLSISSYSNNYYFAYYEETNVTYNIGGNEYYLPMYYFYVNYTS